MPVPTNARTRRAQDGVIRRLGGKHGLRALHVAGAERIDDGYFGPGSVSWEVFGHPQIGLAGLRGLLIAVLDPVGAAGVAQHSTYKQDPLGRVRRSNMFFIATVFGDTRMAQKAGSWLFRRHAPVNGTVPSTGEAYRANTPESLLYVFVTGWHGLVVTYRRFAGHLSATEEREFYAESVITAELMGLPASIVPDTPAKVEDYLNHARREIMRYTDDGRELFEFMRRPPITPAWPMLPAATFLPIATRAAISTFHDTELEIAGIKRWPVSDRTIHPVVWAALNAATLPVLDDLLIIAGPEAWGRRHNGLRHTPGTGRVPLTRKIATDLQTAAAARG